MDENNIDNEKLFAIKLADNEKQVRDKCLKKITNYIRGRSTNNDGNEIVHITPNKKINAIIYFKTFLLKKI